MGAGDVVLESCNTEVLEKLRLVDKTIADLNRLRDAVMVSYSAGRQWAFDKVSVSLDLDSGMFTITEKAPVPAEVPA